MSASKIYTRTGDAGQTRLVGGSQVQKSHPRLESYGTLDELNSHLGLIRCEIEKQFRKTSTEIGEQLNELDGSLVRIQNELFSVGSRLACEDEKMRESLPSLHGDSIERLEKAMDRMNEKLPALREFILPGGCELAARFHVARTVCRRSERHMADLLADRGYAVDFRYVNRLSDYLFMAARFANFLMGKNDVTWKKS